MLLWLLNPKNLSLPALFIPSAQVFISMLISLMLLMPWMK